MKWNRIMWAIGTSTAAFLLLVTLTPAVNWVVRRVQVAPDIRPADAIVVLGSGLMRDGSLTDESLERLVYGLALYKQGLAPILVLSGPRRGDLDPESTVRARFAQLMGVPATAIRELPEVKTTRDEAFDTAALLLPKFRRVLLVTEPLHMRRAKLIFESAGLSVSAAPSNDYAAVSVGPAERLAAFYRFISQSAGLLYYRMAGFI